MSVALTSFSQTCLTSREFGKAMVTSDLDLNQWCGLNQRKGRVCRIVMLSAGCFNVPGKITNCRSYEPLRPHFSLHFHILRHREMFVYKYHYRWRCGKFRLEHQHENFSPLRTRLKGSNKHRGYVSTKYFKIFSFL